MISFRHSQVNPTSTRGESPPHKHSTPPQPSLSPPAQPRGRLLEKRKHLAPSPSSHEDGGAHSTASHFQRVQPRSNLTRYNDALSVTLCNQQIRGPQAPGFPLLFTGGPRGRDVTWTHAYACQWGAGVCGWSRFVNHPQHVVFGDS